MENDPTFSAKTKQSHMITYPLPKEKCSQSNTYPDGSYTFLS